MRGFPDPGTLERCAISANISTGFRVTTVDGRPARLAVIDDAGNIIEAGDAVAKVAWNVCITTQENFWEGQGHLIVHAGPPGSGLEPAALRKPRGDE